jgi:two-component sensor histidine kinase
VLREVEGRIEIVGRLHRLLAEGEQSDALNLGVYLKDVAEMAVSSLGYAERTELSHTSSPDCTVPAEQAILIGLIVGELVTNSLKYAHPTGIAGKISVGCRRTVEAIILVEVEDDGVGLPEGFDPMTQGCLGLHVVRSLAKQLGANPTFESDSLGLQVRLLVPARVLCSLGGSFQDEKARA